MGETARHANQQKGDPPWWWAPLPFFVETLVGVFIFGVIAVAAFGLNVAVDALSARGVDSFILVGQKTSEYCLFGTDLALFARFLWKAAGRTQRALQ